jgi:hypothetical protein
MHVDRNATAVVLDGADFLPVVVDVEKYLNVGAIARHRFINAVVDDLVHQMMETIDAGGPDVHAWTHAYRFQAFEHLDGFGSIRAFGALDRIAVLSICRGQGLVDFVTFIHSINSLFCSAKDRTLASLSIPKNGGVLQATEGFLLYFYLIIIK